MCREAPGVVIDLEHMGTVFSRTDEGRIAPRDIVARAIQTETNEGRGFENEYVHLDLTHLGAERITERLPGIRQIAIDFAGVDPVEAPIPVEPGQLELNVMTPVIIHNILTSVSLLCRYLPVFTGRCVEGIEADEERCRAYLRLNPSLATLLSLRIGYLEAAGLAEEALEKRMPVSDLAVEKGLLTPEEARQIFDPASTARSHFD